KEYLFAAPLVAIMPGVAILITVLAFNFIGDGMRDALDPYMKD
ncbi:glutathione ABC transporter permease, partial [Jeotgalicoccus huakuii]|nr:glutathione ABC transporter permease [Jeotgalicoccus huakuii]